MDSLCLPPCELNIRKDNGRTLILDVLRRKYIVLTPEEWVRQHFTHFLMEHLGYPPTLLQNEVELRCGEKRLRCDSILYGTDARPQMIIEYKAPQIPITQKVFDQISAYNLLLHVDYLIVSNGKSHYCCKMDYSSNSYQFLHEIPAYTSL
ncbi:MAG: type I restriction enzyme HsdR N-terminal domain-containing protein [Prevotella sp.]|nr:type I restriction enzyme HsdR N-terminal domain-containing protein [Prevotella sp.]MDE6152438.1 type I restriction enzyme HsdR N-terminal domain-containing protein [Prevotella sp.]